MSLLTQMLTRKPAEPVVQAFSFMPRVEIYQFGDQSFLMFDSGHFYDTNRSASVLPINMNAGLEIRLSTDLPYEYKLTCGTPDAQMPLATMRLDFPVGEGVLMPMSESVESTIKHTLARVFADACSDFYSRHEVLPQGGHEPQYSVAPQGALLRVKNSKSPTKDSLVEKQKKWGLIAACLVPLMFVLFFWWLGGSGSEPSASSQAYDEAFQKAMATNPEVIESQVQMTKETLKGMGLDAGAAGDLGCLAPE